MIAGTGAQGTQELRRGRNESDYTFTLFGNNLEISQNLCTFAVVLLTS